MEFIENAQKDLFSYMPELTKRSDFDAFWAETLEIAANVPMNIEMIKYNFPSDFVDVFDISYNGFDETRIKGWYLVPKFVRRENLDCIIHYHGFPGNSGRPISYMDWVMMGCAVLAIDLRDQGGRTGNCASYSTGHKTNVLSKGLLDKNEYYLRAVYADCVKAIDFACAQKEVNRNGIVIEGSSQGGGLGMAVCGLDERPCMCLVDVPSYSNIEKRVENAQGAFSSVADYLKIYPYHIDKAMETLSYFDTMNLADKIKCSVFASVGLMDPICPAKWYFATYNRIKARKEIRLYPFNGHDGGGAFHAELKLKFYKENRK